MHRRLLVTGAAGFIGTNFVYYWQEKHPQDRIVALDALTYAGNRSNLAVAEQQPNFCFVHGSILDYDLVMRLLREEGIDTIIHFAAETHVDRSIHTPDAFVQTNIICTHTLLKAVKAVWIDASASTDHSQSTNNHHRYHHVSTDEVYGSLGPADLPFTEETPYRPNSPYAASKAASDHVVRSYHKTYGLPVTISNCSNNFGPYQYPEKIIYVSDRPGHDFRYAIDTRKIEAELGFAPCSDFASHLERCVQWYLDNLVWCQALIQDKEFQSWLGRHYKQNTGAGEIA